MVTDVTSLSPFRSYSVDVFVVVGSFFAMPSLHAYANGKSSIDIYFAYLIFIDHSFTICWCKMQFFCRQRTADEVLDPNRKYTVTARNVNYSHALIYIGYEYFCNLHFNMWINNWWYWCSSSTHCTLAL